MSNTTVGRFSDLSGKFPPDVNDLLFEQTQQTQKQWVVSNSN